MEPAGPSDLNPVGIPQAAGPMPSIRVSRFDDVAEGEKAE
jgi:hypothetical protein